MVPNIILCDRTQAIVDAWQNIFSDLPNVACVCSNFQNQSADYVVSPANSFGFMNGGIDFWYTQFFGNIVQERVQETIKNLYEGELLVGQAFAVPTDNIQFPYLICAPTMRLPMRIMDPIDVFLATRAALRVVEKSSEDGVVETVLFPGMGTGAGAVSPTVCADYMRRAYDDVFVNNKFPDSWEDGLKQSYGPRI